MWSRDQPLLAVLASFPSNPLSIEGSMRDEAYQRGPSSCSMNRWSNHYEPEYRTESIQREIVAG